MAAKWVDARAALKVASVHMTAVLSAGSRGTGSAAMMDASTADVSADWKAGLLAA